MFPVFQFDFSILLIQFLSRLYIMRIMIQWFVYQEKNVKMQPMGIYCLIILNHHKNFHTYKGTNKDKAPTHLDRVCLELLPFLSEL